jgi:hypothetical protein
MLLATLCNATTAGLQCQRYNAAGYVVRRDGSTVVQVAEAGNVLRVKVLRAECLPRMDVTGAADPYVLLTAQSQGGLQMFRLQTRWRTTVRAHACRGSCMRVFRHWHVPSLGSKVLACTRADQQQFPSAVSHLE